ncbi:BirA family biotin operon repressor/biotin-[acetyl-CoA-carboxylase] ligase [Leifsonia sp. AK011]|uniref:biotin--[acetyl-CoA-carboxylase] ligase n=1 Tax=Leifsonia sp. AK011 TaxID=2723075 RepID=UPI0015CE3A3C|nr:biotin--[acetyl-CoA-carboxylase] ligase [Leifsonia sp. AK011]NYF11569.1 BirA family biotin operon repressor/biotin-[acetyl-CoA-carboxylase] ligase [Leifsonia sp. AK011]
MHVEWVGTIDSTNAELVRRASVAPLADLTVLATTDQTAGRGRLGRAWVAPDGSALAVSIYVAQGSAWLPLLTGLAMTRAVRGLIEPPGATLKWPNDVLIGERKVSGILGEIVGGGAVIGAGLNLGMTEQQLPVPTATSLVIEGADPSGLVERALDRYLTEFVALWEGFVASGLDAEGGLRQAVSDACGTLGREVRVELPGGSVREGIAASIDTDGRLVVRDGSGEFAVAAGDVTHVRVV